MVAHKKDILAGIAVLSVSFMFHFQSNDIEGLALLFPRIIIIFLASGGLYLVAKGIIHGRVMVPGDLEGESLDYKRVVTISIGSIVYVLAISLVGFYSTTTLFLFAMAFVLADESSSSSKKVLTGILFTMVLCISVYLVFSFLLNVPTPQGVLM